MTTATPARGDRLDAAARDLGAASTRWRALGTTAQVIVTDPPTLGAAQTGVADVLAAIDLAASRFRDDSELSRLNAAAGEWVAVSPLLALAIRVALDAARTTDGAVDPTVGASLIGLGYDRTFRLVPAFAPHLDIAVVAASGWQHVELDLERDRVRIPSGTIVDLGATAKGLAADLAADAAARAAGCGVLVNLGGDIAVAGPPPDGGWPVAIGDVADPDVPTARAAADPAAPKQTVSIHSGGLATSSTSARRWSRGGSLLHHLIDPRSGLPASSPWRTVSVVAETCADANVASTASVILGATAVGWLSDRAMHARLVGVEGRVVTVGGWPAEDAT
jgi:thiamine biosynthesis lipoprotein ApbE